MGTDLLDDASRDPPARGFFRALVEASGDVFLVLAADGTILGAAGALESVLGRTAAELTGRSVLADVHAEDRSEVEIAIAGLLDDPGWRARLRYRARHSDGSWRWLDAVARNALTDPRVAGLVLQARDVTEHTAREERLRVRGYLFDAAGLSVIATDLEGRVTYWNRAAEELFGWTSAEALGRPILELTPSAPDEGTAREILAALERGERWSGEIVLRRRDGATFLAEVTDAPVHDEEGRLVGIIGIASDAGPRRRLETEARQAQKMEAVGRLAGGIAHDFNNLLTAIRGHTTFLAEAVPASSPLLSDVRRIDEAVQRAADLTRQLLAFSRRQMLEERILDLGDTVTQAEPILRRLVPDRITLDLRLPEEPVLVRGDVSQLHQVLLNLVVNATDAIESEGRIEVEVGAREVSPSDAAVFPWKIAPGPYATLRVRDTGHGIPPELHARIFEPFFTTREAGEGTGLGLSTVYGIVKQSQGHVMVESAVGEGAAFTMLLPRLVSTEPAPRGGPATRAERGPGGERVLVVEDDRAVRQVVRRILERADYVVLEAGDGAEALERLEAERERVDLVLSDLVMPDMGGIELAQRLRRSAPRTRFLVMSGHSEEELASGTAAREVRFLGKPFTAERLLACVRRALDDPAPRGG